MSQPNRGRIQAQSNSIEESVSWAQDEPPTLEDGQKMIVELKNKLSSKELKKREEQFEKLERFMKTAQENGGIEAPISRNYVNPKLKDGTRVDFELKAGAFALTAIILLIIFCL